MTAADFTPVTPEAAAGFLDAALFDGAPADERLLDAWATIVAQGERIAAVLGRCETWEQNFVHYAEADITMRAVIATLRRTLGAKP